MADRTPLPVKPCRAAFNKFVNDLLTAYADVMQEERKLDYYTHADRQRSNDNG